MSQAATISRETAQNFIDVFNDPERAANFTPEQMGQMRESLTNFVEANERRSSSLQSQGLTEGQTQEVMQKEADASDADSLGTFGRGQSPTGTSMHQRAAARVGSATLEGSIQLIEGLVDLGLEAGAWMGSDRSREMADDFKDWAGQRRFQEKLSDIEKYGETNPFFGETAAAAAVTAPATAVKAVTIPRYLLYNSMIGVGYSAAILSEKTLDERLGDMALGGGLGLGLSVLGAPSATKYYAARTYQRQFNLAMAEQNLELEQMMRTLTGNENFGFSVSQLTGSRFVNRLEQQAHNRIAKKQQNENINTVWKHLLTRARDLRARATPGTRPGIARPAMDAGQIAKEMRGTLAAANKAIHDRASGNFALALDGIMDRFGGDLIIGRRGAQEYLFKIQKLINEGSSRFAPGSNVSPAFRRYMDNIDLEVNPVHALQNEGKDTWRVVNRQTGEIIRDDIPNQQMAQTKALQQNEILGGFDAIETTEIVRGVNDLMRGRFKVLDAADDISTNRAIGKALYGELINTFEAAGNNKMAVNALADMRGAYRGEMARIQHMEDLAVNSVFGQKLAAADPDRALDTVLAGGRASMDDTRKFLEEWHPMLLDELQSTLLRRAAQRSRTPGAAGVDTAVSLDKLANELAGPQGIGQLGRGLFEPKMQGELVRLGQALRVIQNNYTKGIAGATVGVDDLTINVISRSPEFMGRFLSRVFASGKSMETMLFDPMARQSLITLAEAGPTTKAGKAALVALTRFMVGSEQAEKENLSAEKHAAAVRALERRGM